MDKDFDFFGQTAQVSDAMSEEQLRYNRHYTSNNRSISPHKNLQPARTGYEKYKGLEQVSDLHVDPSLWGAPPRPAGNAPPTQHAYTTQPRPQAPPSAAAGRKMLSLEEVEAQMAAQSKRTPESRAEVDGRSMSTNAVFPPPLQTEGHDTYASAAALSQRHLVQSRPPTQPTPLPQHHRQATSQPELPAPHQGPQTLPKQQQARQNQRPGDQLHQANQYFQNLMNPRPPSDGVQPQQPAPPRGPQGFKADARIITHPRQLMQLSEEERGAYLVEEAKRAKRNHKIFMLSRDNGLMTPQDKNFITRIQLQQLMQVSGPQAAEKNPDAAIAEDFYYQVYSQIRSGPRPNPRQPLNHFAQTYLHQTGSRHGGGGGGRRQNRGENHMQRMEQQVQRAVEAAKQKPKNTQLVLEGSLGKIAFSNAKAPRATLNLKRPDGADPALARLHSAQRSVSHRRDVSEPSAGDAKSALRNVEAAYTALMRVEDEARNEPPPPSPGGPPERAEAHAQWAAALHACTEQLWRALQVLAPVDPDAAAAHPFIAMLARPKGKKILPRAFRFLTPTQRLTAVTSIFLHLDALDVVRHGVIPPGSTQPAGGAPAREAIELFSAAVLPCLFAFVSEAPLFNVIGLLGLLLDRTHVARAARSRVGLAVLTMLTSRATLLREAGGATDEGEWAQWAHAFDRLFDALEPALPGIFPMPINSGEDMYIWQFLAAMGSGASPDQQSRLVIAVK